MKYLVDKVENKASSENAESAKRIQVKIKKNIRIKN